MFALPMNNMPKQILIADDDPGIVDAVQMMLDFYGYNASYTYDGATLLHQTENYPDLVLLDIWMSGTDGRDVCKALKSKPEWQQVPVIMISASKDIAQSAYDAGADDFLPKPFDMDVLISRIEEQLHRKQSPNALAV